MSLIQVLDDELGSQDKFFIQMQEELLHGRVALHHDALAYVDHGVTLELSVMEDIFDIKSINIDILINSTSSRSEY